MVIRIIIIILLMFSVAFATSSRVDLEDMVRYQMRMVGDTEVLTNAQLRAFINQAIKEFDNKARPYQMFDTIWTTKGTTVYALNSDCHKGGVYSARILVDSTDYIYQAMTSILARDEGKVVEGELIGVPKWYSQWGGYLQIDPPPSVTYRIELKYEATSSVLSVADADSLNTVTTIPTKYDQAIVDYAIILIYKRLGSYDKALQLEQSWKVNVMEVRALLREKPDPLVGPIGERGQ